MQVKSCVYYVYIENTKYSLFQILPFFVYKLPVYENQEDESVEKCLKKFPKHKKFSPGLIAIACKHGICYGFQILRQHESTVVVYYLLTEYCREEFEKFTTFLTPKKCRNWPVFGCNWPIFRVKKVVLVFVTIVTLRQ